MPVALRAQPHPPAARPRRRAAASSTATASSLIDNRAVVRRRARARGRARPRSARSRRSRSSSARGRRPRGDRRRPRAKRPPFEDVVVQRDLDWDEVVALETHQLELPGRVGCRSGRGAPIPTGRCAAHLLGYVGEVNQHELRSATRLPHRRSDRQGRRWSATGRTTCAASTAASRSRSTRSAASCACSTRSTRRPGNTLVLTHRPRPAARRRAARWASTTARSSRSTRATARSSRW